MKTLGILAAILIPLLVVIVYVFSVSNNEAGLRNLINAKQTANTTEQDNMWKTIKQTAQVTEAQKDAIMQVVVGYATARGGNGKAGSLATLVHESVPNVDTTAFVKLQNVIDSKRSEWTRAQKELIDYKREHDNLIDMQPSGLVCSILGRKKIEIVVITSAQTKETFRTGEENEVDLFQKTDTKRVEK